MNKIIELGRKLLALSERGVGGEKENAKQMLEAFLKKYNLTINEISPATRTERLVIKVTEDTRQMFINLTASILGNERKLYRCRGRGMWKVEMNDAEWYEFEEKWEVYRLALKKELQKLKKQHLKEIKLLGHAFISKHNLYNHDEPQSTKLPTEEEMQELYDMLRLKRNLKDINIHKKLS